MKRVPTYLLTLLRARRFSVVILYCLLTVVYFSVFWQEFIQNLEAPTWFIAPIMAFGSFVAGSTFLGGGSVAFPALTKILAVDPVTAKTFSLAIQSVGMTSASIYIISRVRNLPYAFMALYLVGASGGILTSLAFLENAIPSVDLRISFTLFLLCFLLVYLLTRHSNNASLDTHLEKTLRDISLTVGCGFLGGVVSGLLGSGADLIGFSLLALYFRIEIKRATQISVILMAATALVGTGLQGWVFNRLSEEVISLWYVAAPIVLFGAPIGAVFCRRISPKFLLLFICSIVALEFISTLILIKIDMNRSFIYGLAAIASIVLLLLFRHQATIKHD